MGKTTKNFLVIIVIAIVVIFALVCLEYQHFRFEPISANNVETKGNILPDPNQGLNNMLNEILDDNIETEVKTEEKKNETTTASNDSVEDKNQMTPKENKAINLVKDVWTKDWGNLDDVSFNVSIQSDGKYYVTVYDTVTTHLIKGYIVDVNTEIVTEK
ncbi:unknown [Clostridium sp. CAG:508]|mgnify:CR=1 FL=1|jgi:uncharacterized FlaG/YvyC family protein|nr:unknown [Clostridium sp. CAG:508]